MNTMNILREAHEKACELINYLIIVKKDIVKDKLKELPYLPHTTDLNEVCKIIQDEKGKVSLTDNLNKLSILINDESKNVRFHALMELKRILKENGMKINALILDGPSLSETIQLLIESLFNIFKLDNDKTDHDRSIRLVCLEVIGELGAIDPNRLLRPAVSLERGSELESLHLALYLINEILIKELKSSVDNLSQNQIEFAIQGLLPYIHSRILLNNNKTNKVNKLILANENLFRSGVIVDISSTNDYLIKFDKDVKGERDSIEIKGGFRCYIPSTSVDLLAGNGGSNEEENIEENLLNFKIGDKVFVNILPFSFPKPLEKYFQLGKSFYFIFFLCGSNIIHFLSLSLSNRFFRNNSSILVH